MSGIRRNQSSACQPEAPFFLLPPRNAAVHQGDTATFYVKVKGEPEPEVRWFRDGVSVSPGGCFSLQRMGEGVHVFTVTHVGPDTAGRYLCQVTNCAGDEQTTIRLELKDQLRSPRGGQINLRRIHSWGESHPRFVTKPCSQTVRPGQKVLFKARVTGRPPPRVTWLKGAAVLEGESAAQAYFTSGFHVLELQEARQEDQGLYTCELSNLAGQTRASAQLTVRDLSPSSSPLLNCTRNQIYLKPSEDRDGERARATRTPAKTSTQKARTDSPPSAENRPHPAAVCEAPVFTQPLEDCSVDEGCDIRLRGVITGSQPIRISWLHNGEPVRFGRPSFQGSMARLVVEECLPEDAGAYTCVAENKAGKTSSSAAVCVRDFETICKSRRLKSSPAPNCVAGMKTAASSPLVPLNNSIHCNERQPCAVARESGQRKGLVTPKRRASSVSVSPVQVVDSPVQVEVLAGERAELKCTFRHCSHRGSRPAVAATWIRNKREVVDGPRVRVETSEKGSSLVILEAHPDDSGSYTLLAKDCWGSAKHTITLSVIDRPQPPAGRPFISQLGLGSLVLSWSGPCYDGGSAVTSYVVEVRKEGPGPPGNWIEVTGSCWSTSYRVRSGLEPQGEYRFRVKAINIVGVSQPSQESDAVRMDSAEAAGEMLEEPQSYTVITINTTQKVTDFYDKLEKLGVGKFGQVFKLVHKETGQVCAGKYYKARTSKDKAAARNEIELMNCLHHPKLVQCLGAFESRTEIVMVMEYIAGGELFERIVDDNFQHTEPTSVRYMQQILEGIQYMHQQGIVHLDLKPENIVCVNTTGTLIKIIDFGLASKLDPKNPLKVMHGTPEFVAPEVISFEPVERATDMWSIGVICYILLSGESPFQGNTEAETLALVTAANWEFDEESFEEITDEAKDFISGLLKKDMRKRLSCKEALAHPWMAAFVSVDPRSTKTLSKDKMKKYLAKQKWKKTGKALLALKRMSLLSNRLDSPISLINPADDSSLTPEEELALLTLDEKLRCKPQFPSPLSDVTQPQGSTAHLRCLVIGYPDPEVLWMHGTEPVEEASRIQIEYTADGHCSLLLSGLLPQDSGVYTCKAINSQGEALCSATLTVSPVKRSTNR
ncbi:myosin light chain kinase, smooth muscle isoform X2 [Amia ocellicauda]|uniref:myosin light chain kinase, smooth muscle isoform X2 n=1 Tax=Amia ocellicauda TaxID=2972642 RepID=UPI003463BE03